MVDTETGTRIGIPKFHEFLIFFEEKDPYFFNLFLKDVRRCIKNHEKRIYNARDIISFYKEPSLLKKVRKAGDIKNKELLKRFLFDFPSLKEFEIKLLSFPNLKIAFKNVFGSYTDFNTYEDFFKKERELFKENILKAERIRKSYLGKPVFDKDIHFSILACATHSPLGSRRIAGNALYDLAQYRIGLGVYGEPLTWKILRDRYSVGLDPMIEQFDHPNQLVLSSGAVY